MRKVFIVLIIIICFICCEEEDYNSDLEIGVPYTFTMLSGLWYLNFTPEVSGQHTISLTNLTCDMEWLLSTDFECDHILNECDNYSDNSDEIDTTTWLVAGTRYYLRVLIMASGIPGENNFTIQVSGP